MPLWLIGLSGLCLATLCLTAWDRQTRTWALIVTGCFFSSLAVYALSEKWGQLMGPVFSLFICSTTLTLFLRNPRPWKAAVHALAVVMLLLDGYFFFCGYLGVYVGVEYATLTNTGLIAQLFLIGHRGALNAWRSLLGRGVVRVYRASPTVSRSGRREA